MKEMYIPCKTAQEKQEVIKHLVSLGYIDEDTDDHYLNLRIYENDCIQSVVDNHCGKLEVVTPQQLLNKQETPTMNKLKEAVQNSGLNKSELSRRLGKHRNYLGEILRVGCSTKKQNELIEMINQVKAGERFKSDDEIIAELSEKLEKSQKTSQHNADCAHKYLNMVHERDEHINELKESEAFVRQCNTTLEKEAKYAIKNAQELAGELENEKASVRQLNGELIELSEFKDKLEGELTKAGEELIYQDKVIEQRNNECIRLEDEITLLNKENSELNKQRKSYMAAFFMLLSLIVICLLWSAFK